MNEEKVAINEASLEELKTLDGIGNEKAQAIIDNRNMFGDFQNVEEIKAVPGIGDKTYEAIKDKITLYSKSEFKDKKIKETKAKKDNTILKVKDYYTLKDRIQLKRAMKKATKKEIRMNKKFGRLMYLNSKKNLMKLRINEKKAKIQRFIEKLSYYRISEVKKRIALRIEEKRERIQRSTEEKMASYLEQQNRMAALNETNKQLLDQLLGRGESQEEIGEMQTAKVR